MWLFTDFGFFSVVKHKSKDSTLVVRGRSLGDLRRLVQGYGSIMDVREDDIRVTPDSDYYCRVEVNQTSWSNVLFQVSENIDYHNFKDAVHERMGARRAETYMDVWTTMYSLQNWERKNDLNKGADQAYDQHNETPSNTSRGDKDNG